MVREPGHGLHTFATKGLYLRKLRSPRGIWATGYAFLKPFGWKPLRLCIERCLLSSHVDGVAILAHFGSCSLGEVIAVTHPVVVKCGLRLRKAAKPAMRK